MPPSTDSEADAEGGIDCIVRGGLLLMAINRPAKRNGFTPAMMNQLSLAYTLLDDDPALRVGVVCAEGEHFTGGLDLPTFAGLMQRGEVVAKQQKYAPNG